MAQPDHPVVTGLKLGLLPARVADYGRQMLADVEACKRDYERSKQATDPAFAIAYLESAKANLKAATSAEDRLGACLSVAGRDEAEAALAALEAQYRAAGHYTVANRRAAYLIQERGLL